MKVGFKIIGSDIWTGGITYLYNLLYALTTLKDRKIDPVIFAGRKVEEHILDKYRPFSKIVRSSLFDERSATWWNDSIIGKMIGVNPHLDRLMKKHHISVFSHSSILLKRPSLKLVNWIPDFQHIHLPYMFTRKEVIARDTFYSKIIRDSDLVILSSDDALTDYKLFAPQYLEKARVLHFVAQPLGNVYELEISQELKDRHGIHEKYFYLPNQFWKHKNHLIVFKAIKILKDGGKNICLLCSGRMNDYRNRNHINELIAYIRNNELGENIKMLGFVNEEILFYLIRNCISVLNPSLFEGWSTTVEEAKSVGKSLILSNIGVHIEQNPPNSIYFDPTRADELAEILWERWDESEGGPDEELENSARKSIKTRTERYGLGYQNLIEELFER
jgi:glycosyltransferase involved in cell wall biosynthesis